MGQFQFARPDDRSRRCPDRRRQNRSVRKVRCCPNLIAETGNIVHDAESLADPGVARAGPDALRIEKRAKRYLIAEITCQLITDRRVALSRVWNRIC